MVTTDFGSNIYTIFPALAQDLFLKNLAAKFQILEICFKRQYSLIIESKVILAYATDTTGLY